MILGSHWQKATRPREVRLQGEAIFSHCLLEFFNSPEQALRAKENHRRCPSPFNDWPRAVHFAYETVYNTLNLSPSERKETSFTVDFDE